MNILDLTIGLKSGDHLHIEVIEIIPNNQQGAGDFSVAVSVSCDGFTVLNRVCWIEYSDFNVFVTALRSFESIRVGSAAIKAMSPEDFGLYITSDSPAKWPSVSGYLSGTYKPNEARCQLTFSFTLDASFINEVLQSFEHILSTLHKTSP